MKHIFTIPSALNGEDRLVTPEEAIKGDTYYCPECRKILTFRKGTKKRSHFAHRAKSKCSRESVIHIVGKLLVIRAFDDWWAGTAPEPIIQYECKQCKTIQTRYFAQGMNRHSYEHTLSSGYRADVALLQDEIVKLAVEVYVHNRVTGKKTTDIGIDYAELKVDDIMESNCEWRPINQTWQDMVCEACAEKNRIAEEQRLKREEEHRQAEEREQKVIKDTKHDLLWGEFEKRGKNAAVSIPNEVPFTGFDRGIDDWRKIKLIERYVDTARDVARRTHITLPPAYFRYKIDRCWKCKKEILLFTWPGRKKWDSRRPPYRWLAIFPTTMKLVPNKKTRQSYWANTCPFPCEAVQGDDYVNFALPAELDDSLDGFRKDLFRLAVEYFHRKKLPLFA